MFTREDLKLARARLAEVEKHVTEQERRVLELRRADSPDVHLAERILATLRDSLAIRRLDRDMIEGRLRDHE